jgi:uncharacterized protein (DUF1330 family)
MYADSYKEAGAMPTYMIIQISIKDRERFINDYAKPASKLVEQFGGRYLVKSAGCEVLEGGADSRDSVVISEWPDRQSIHDMWHSSEYQTIKKLREGAADCSVVVVDGLG